MRSLRFKAVGMLVLLLIPALSQAQVKTYMYDHIHMSVPDPQAAAQWYFDNIGGEWVDGRTDRLLIGTTRVMFLGNGGTARKPSAGSVIDHLGFSFTDLPATVAKLRANGATIEGDIRDVPGLFPLAFAVDPFGTRLELVQEPQHLGLHHIHLRAPDPTAALDWYEATFGGIRKNLKGRLDGILYPGNVWILVSRGDTFPSTEGSIDHIGWRALPDSQTTLSELLAKKVSQRTEPRDMTLPNGVIRFFYVNGPDGANIELVQRAPDMP